MTIINNVNMTKLDQIVKEAQADPSKMKRVQKIQGDWLLDEEGPQFRAEISFEGGKVVFESDQPTFLGGAGTKPGPLHYCFFGMLSCYTATFATMAAMMGIKLKGLSAGVEGDLDFSRVFGLSQDPIMQEVRIVLRVESDAPHEKLEEIERLSRERCPAVFALTERVKLESRLEVM